MKYVALLRGINVGGKCIMKMAAVRRCLEDAGFKQVTTYIQSGNVIVDTDERTPSVVTRRIEAALSASFAYKRQGCPAIACSAQRRRRRSASDSGRRAIIFGGTWRFCARRSQQSRPSGRCPSKTALTRSAPAPE